MLFVIKRCSLARAPRTSRKAPPRRSHRPFLPCNPQLSGRETVYEAPTAPVLAKTAGSCVPRLFQPALPRAGSSSHVRPSRIRPPAFAVAANCAGRHTGSLRSPQGAHRLLEGPDRDAGLDLAFGQVPVADDALLSAIGVTLVSDVFLLMRILLFQSNELRRHWRRDTPPPS